MTRKTPMLVLGAALALAAMTADAQNARRTADKPLPKEAFAICAPPKGRLTVTGTPGEPGVRMYARPRMTSLLRGILPLHASGIVKGSCKIRFQNLWCEVTWGCLTGYVRMVYLDNAGKRQPVMHRAQVVGRPVDLYLMLHAAPDPRSKGIAAISPTATVDVADCVVGEDDQEWCAVIVGSRTGWAPAKNLSF